MRLSPKLASRLALVLMSLIFLLVQFIGEIIIISFIVRFSPALTVVLYASKRLIVAVHFVITALLVMWAKQKINSQFGKRI